MKNFKLLRCSVQFSCSVVSDSLQSHGLQHTRLLCPSPAPRTWSNSCPLVMPSNRLVLCRPLLLLPSIFPSIMVFSNESVFHIRWPIRSFNFSISEYSALISFRMDWLDLLQLLQTEWSLFVSKANNSISRWFKPGMLDWHTGWYAPTSNTEEAEVEWFYEDLQDFLELTSKKRCPFHYRGLECKSRKSRNTWSNGKIWP